MLMTAICNCWPVRRKSGQETYLNRKLYAPDETIPDSDPDGLHLPDDIRLGILMLISHFYENRSSVTEVEKLDMPQSFGWLVGPYRYFPQ